jgi:hypothetical protein
MSAAKVRWRSRGWRRLPCRAVECEQPPVNDLYMFTIAPNGTMGTSSRVGTTGIAIDGLAFNSQGTLYALGQDSATIYTINTLTAAATAVGPVTVAGAPLAKNSPIGGIAIAPANPEGVEEIYAAIDDRLFIVSPTTAQGRVASNDVINFGPLVSSVSGVKFTPARSRSEPLRASRRRHRQ